MKTLNLLTSFVLFALIISTNINAQSIKGDGNVVTEDREVSGFTGIRISSGIDLYVKQGTDELCQIETDKNLMDAIVTEVNDGILKIYCEKSIRTKKTLKAHVTIKEFNSLVSSGGSDIYTLTEINSDNFKITSSGGSDLEFDLNANNLEARFSGGSDAKMNCNVKNINIVASGGSDLHLKKLDADECNFDISGGSDVDIAGKTSKLRIDASGGSDVDAYDLESKDCYLKLSGSSDVNVYVTEEFNVTASGGSDVNYKGNPSETNINASKTCSIHHR